MPDQLAALVLVHDRPGALLRVVSVCHRRGWSVVALTWSSDGVAGEAALRLSPPASRSTALNVAAQLRRLVDVVDVVSDHVEPALPDPVAFASLRHAAPWHTGAKLAPLPTAA